MSCSVDIISIGTLSRNPFWGEQAAVRPAHATTTLIRDDQTAILVDPSLPEQLIEARLFERSGLRADDIDIIFLTNFRPVHRRGIRLFSQARWLMGEDEIAAAAERLETAADFSGDEDDADPDEIEDEWVILRRVEAAPDQIAPAVSLFPSPGATPGACGLLVSALRTTVIAGDAVLTHDHFAHARVDDRSFDAQAAMQSFQDILEVAELIVPGHDNFMIP